MTARYTYRTANEADLQSIVKFVDTWLSGMGINRRRYGSLHDAFIPYGQHYGYLKYKVVYLCLIKGLIVAWAVMQKNGTLIHLLVAPHYRGVGIGSELIRILDPIRIRSKSNQSTGNPIEFYKKHGYVFSHSESSKPKGNTAPQDDTRPKIIDVMIKPDLPSENSLPARDLPAQEGYDSHG